MKEYSYGICPYIEKDGKNYILMIQPKGHKEWGFCKGKIEKNESKKDCALRETFEEIGLKVDKKNLEDYFEQYNRRKDVGIYLFNMNNLNLNTSFKLNKKEVHKIKLFDLESDIKIYTNQKEILKQIRKKFLDGLN